MAAVITVDVVKNHTDNPLGGILCPPPPPPKSLIPMTTQPPYIGKGLNSWFCNNVRFAGQI